jgi:predicted MFS family arabinose efflux permease
MIWLPREIGVRLPSTSLGGLWSTLARHETLLTLGVTAFWAMGGYVVYPYIALVFRAGIGMESSQVGAILFLYGIAACVGLVVGERIGLVLAGLCYLHFQLLHSLLAAYQLLRTFSLGPLPPFACWLQYLYGLFVAGRSSRHNRLGLLALPA